MERRLKSLAATIIIAFLMAGIARAEVPAPTGWSDQQAPGFYRFHVGDFRITVLADGTASRNLSTIMSKPGAVREAFEASHEALPTEISINCFLVDTGSTKILVDTGAGELFGNTAGHLVTNLRSAGYDAADIDAILLTHIHGDHSGGLTVGGQRIFPKAFVYVDPRDLSFWPSDEENEKAAPNRKLTFEQSRQTVGPYVQAGKLRPFDGASELFAGIQSIPEYGHTPGHTAHLVTSGGQRLLLWGNIVHSAEVQFADPSVTIEYDVDPQQAIASRRHALEAAARDGHLVGGAHLSFPGVGHIRVEQGKYAWVPAPYTSRP
jgi:glyoxylase-like metal-dependent hydrolase (beta-lactamase superfamily II)